MRTLAIHTAFLLCILTCSSLHAFDSDDTPAKSYQLEFTVENTKGDFKMTFKVQSNDSFSLAVRGRKDGATDYHFDFSGTVRSTTNDCFVNLKIDTKAEVGSGDGTKDIDAKLSTTTTAKLGEIHDVALAGPNRLALIVTETTPEQ